MPATWAKGTPSWAKAAWVAPKLNAALQDELLVAVGQHDRGEAEPQDEQAEVGAGVAARPDRLDVGVDRRRRGRCVPSEPVEPDVLVEYPSGRVGGV